MIGRDQQHRANLVDLAERGPGGGRHLVGQFALDVLQEAGDQLDRQHVGQAGGVAVVGEAERIEDVAVPRQHAVLAEGVLQAARIRPLRAGTACCTA